EALTPVIGWAAGLATAPFIQAVDHWIALVLLGAIGGKMIYESLQPPGGARPSRHSLGVLSATAIGNSIDALAVGVVLAFLDADIAVAALAIGLATFFMTSSGMMIARWVGPRLGSWAEMVGGAGLVLLGIGIFVEHTLAG